MSKFKLTVNLDTENPYHNEILKILRALPTPQERKDFIISALLYYAKSPSYMMTLALEEHTAKLSAYKEAPLLPTPESLASIVSQAVTSALSGLKVSSPASVLLPEDLHHHDFNEVEDGEVFFDKSKPDGMSQSFKDLASQFS